MEKLSLKLEFLFRVREKCEIHNPRFHLAFGVNMTLSMVAPSTFSKKKAYPSGCRHIIRRKTKNGQPLHTALTCTKHSKDQLMLSRQFLSAWEALKQKTPKTQGLEVFNWFSNKFQAAVGLIKTLLRVTFPYSGWKSGPQLRWKRELVQWLRCRIMPRQFLQLSSTSLFHKQSKYEDFSAVFGINLRMGTNG